MNRLDSKRTLRSRVTCRSKRRSKRRSKHRSKCKYHIDDNSPPKLSRSLSTSSIHMTKTMRSNLQQLRREKKETARYIKLLEIQNKNLVQNLTDCNNAIEILEHLVRKK